MRVLISSFSSFRSSSNARFRCGRARTSARNSSERIEMSGFFSPAAAKMSTTWSDETAFETSCRTAWSRSSADRCLPAVDLASAARMA